MERYESPRQKNKGIVDTYFSRIYSLKSGDAFFLKTTLLVLCVFLILFLIQLSQNNALTVATSGGTFSEGVIGTPRFVNPVLAVTRADKDLTTLLYDGLMALGKEGTLVPNIAESLTISEDGLTYNIVLKENVSFHDGVRLTSRDVASTVGRIQDPLLGSPLRANFDGVTVEEISDREINFILPESYTPFIENLTFGILPEHIWKDASSEEFPFSQNNSEPIGSGPYRVETIVRNASGIPESYILKAYTEHHNGTPKIETVEFHFFPTEDKFVEAFKKGTIESVVGVDAELVQKLNINPETNHLERIPLPRTFAVFINQNKSPALRDTSAREALSLVIDRNALVLSSLKGYGNAITSPIPVGFGISMPPNVDTPKRLETARDILRKGGWKPNPESHIWEKSIDGSVTPLSFSIATVNNSTFEATAEFLRTTWQTLGAEVSIKQFEQSDLIQAIIRPRDYEALLFGTQLGRSLDYYSFWHSSQRNDPGLNVALYANITTDSILSEMRRDTNREGRADAIIRFAEEIKKENPAIFLYAPELLYVFPNRVQDASFTGVEEPHERLSGIGEWYIETESVWPFFTQ